MFGGITFAGALFGGVVGIVGPLPAVPLTPGIIIDGIDVTARVRVQGVTIRDVLNDAPNTANLTIEGAAPTVGQSVTITVGPRALFTGAIQTIDQAYESLPTHVAWHLTAIDDTGRANMRRPFGTFVDTSATTIAQTITTTYAPGFATTGIAAGLPTVTITFDGADTFIACLARLATAVGGYCKIEDRRVYLFLVDPADPPDPIDANHRFLINPPITLNTDVSQLRTRVYGKGYGETVPTDVLANETLVPLQNGVMFPAAGGRAIAGTTADGAQSQQITFASVFLSTGGTLVGPGVSPTNAPGLRNEAGTGIESGDHDYAYAFVTAVGRTAVSPRTRIQVGIVPPPTGLPSNATPQVGMGPENGVHQYAISHVTATGETTPGPTIPVVTSTSVVAPPPTAQVTESGSVTDEQSNPVGWNVGDTVYFAPVYEAPGGTTTAGPASTPFVARAGVSGQPRFAYAMLPIPADGRVTSTRLYYNINGAWRGWKNYNATGLSQILAGPAPNPSPPAPPATNTAGTPSRQVLLSGLPAALTFGTARKVWGTVAGGTQLKFIATINTTDTSYTVTTLDAALGVNAPTVGTAQANRVTITWPVSGASAVTGVEIYRTAVGSAQLKLLFAIAGNVATSIIDSTPDASLGANAPTGDTSGLTQPTGQVNPGSPTLLLATAAPFRSGGGWVTLPGRQVVRYTAISGNSLTGIPASGPGAITTTVLYGQQALPTPMLVDVSGLALAMAQGATVAIWVQRDDALAQADHAARTGTDGVVEFLIVDSRRGAPSLTARCDADLKLFSRPILTAQYATRDMKTASGKTVSINLASPPIAATMIIHEVTITEIGLAPNLPPRYTVKASTVRFSLEDTLRRLIAGGLTSVND